MDGILFLGFDENDIPDYNDQYLSLYDHIDSSLDLSMDLPTVDEFLTYATDVSLNKGSCVDGISTLICKDLMLQIPNRIVHIYSTYIKSGIFPEIWSKGVITVIPKSGKLSDPTNWRPITQTSIFAKIFEKIIHNRVITYFLDNNILSDFQYGFRKGKSTQQAIFDLTKFIYSNLNHKKLLCAVCLDVAKAFDCINYDVLIHKMSYIGFNHNTIAWFKSYLSRTQVVRFKDSMSSTLRVKTGIGQGTILGPLLFIFYINDLVTVLKHFKINMYADDCILYNSGNNWDTMSAKLQPELVTIQGWFTDNRLRLNIKKSKNLLLGSRNKLTRVDYTKTLNISGNVLNFADKYKYLGTTLDKEMTLNGLLVDVKKSVLNKLFTLRKLRKYITEKCSISIYKQTNLPIFDYVGFLLIACNKSDRQDLQVLQNDALRTCYNVRRRDHYSVSKLHRKSNLISLEQRRKIQLLSLMYIHKENPRNLRNRERHTREADRIVFHTEIYRNCKYQSSPYFKGAQLWSKLRLDLTKILCLITFKRELKKLYKNYNDEL